MADNITITYSVDAQQAPPNEAKAETDYKGTSITAYGATWAEAKDAVLGRCGQIKSLGDPPPAETVDLDPPAAG